MDVVYILGSGSLANDEEILYSVRSLCKNMLDLGNVYVVGEMPQHLPAVEHYFTDDPYPEKWRNAYHKISFACSIPELSDEFLLMNDDFFMLAPFSGDDFAFYALKDSNGGSCGAHSFQVHCPIRICKEWWQKMPFDLKGKACKSPRTFYANFYGAPPTFIEDPVLRVGERVPDIYLQLRGKKFFSISDHAMLYFPFVDWLRSQYPSGCKFEI